MSLKICDKWLNKTFLELRVFEYIRISNKIVKTIIYEEILKVIQAMDKTIKYFKLNIDLFIFHKI